LGGKGEILKEEEVLATRKDHERFVNFSGFFFSGVTGGGLLKPMKAGWKGFAKRKGNLRFHREGNLNFVEGRAIRPPLSDDRKKVRD